MKTPLTRFKTILSISASDPRGVCNVYSRRDFSKTCDLMGDCGKLPGNHPPLHNYCKYLVKGVVPVVLFSSCNVSPHKGSQ